MLASAALLVFSGCDKGSGTGSDSGIAGVPPVAVNDTGVGISCKAYLDAGLSVGDGIYTIDPDGSGGLDPFEVYCDMTTDNGGWTLVVKQNSDVLAGPDAINISGMINMEHGKLSDTMIASIDYTTVKISSNETDINVYVDDTNKLFGWDKGGMGYNGVSRSQCAATEQSLCSWYNTTHVTIDLLYDGGGQGELCSRYWIDHDGFNVYEKSFRGGSACVNYAHLDAYVWVK